MNTHRLIGAQVSLYTGKVRAYLDYKALPYQEVLATREVYRDVILPRVGVRFIPVLISDDDVAVQDSSEIIAFLEARHPAPSSYFSGRPSAGSRSSSRLTPMSGSSCLRCTTAGMCLRTVRSRSPSSDGCLRPVPQRPNN